MIKFDSSRNVKWSGSGFKVASNSILLGNRGSASSDVIIPKSGRIKIVGRKRSGSGAVRLQLISKDKSIIFDKDVHFNSSSWKEQSFEIGCEKNIAGLIRVSRSIRSHGRVEIGRLVILSDEARRAERQTDEGVKKDNNVIDNTIFSPKFFKIAIVVPYSIYGGAEVYLRSILGNIVSNKLKIDILYPSKGNALSNINKKNIRNVVLGSRSRLEPIIASGEYDTILFYNSAYVYKTLSSLKASGSISSKIIEIYHSDFEWSDAVSKIKHREGVDMLFRVSESLAEDIVGIDSDCKIHMPVGIDSKEFAPRDGVDLRKSLNIPMDKPIIGTVCRMSPEKDIPYFLDLADSMRDFFFIAIGGGPKLAEYKSRSARMSNVRFLGHSNNIGSMYCLFDAFLLTSVIEGTPISLLEAMSSGLTVFAPRVGAIPTVINNSLNGFFISKDINTDAELLRLHYDNRSVSESAREYVLNNHNLFKISSKFVRYLPPGRAILLERSKDIKVLPGVYI